MAFLFFGYALLVWRLWLRHDVRGLCGCFSIISASSLDETSAKSL